MTTIGIPVHVAVPVPPPVNGIRPQGGAVRSRQLPIVDGLGRFLGNDDGGKCLFVYSQIHVRAIVARPFIVIALLNDHH